MSFIDKLKNQAMIWIKKEHKIMRRCYVGVGGIGYRLLKEYEKTRNGKDRFVYIDATTDDLH